MTAIESILLVFGIYLGIGLITVIIFDIITQRIRKRIYAYSFDTHQMTGQNHTIAIIFTLIAIWIFYPALIIGALKKNNGKEEQT